MGNSTKRKKSLIVVLMLAALLMLSSCGMAWQEWKKDFKSDVGGGLPRDITVVNMYTDEVIWEYSGVAYIDSESTSGDITVIYRDQNGVVKKADFIGLFYGMHMFEK